MNIPGLDIPVVPEGTFCDSEGIMLTSFRMGSFTVPAEHKYGRCRSVTDFEMLLVLRDGENSIVYKAADKRSGEIVALKELKVSVEQDPQPKNLLREISNLKKLNHPNIVNLITVAVGQRIDSTYLILEYCDYSLAKVIETVDERLLRHPQIKNILWQLFAGLDYIHKHGICHRNLGPMNILFTKEGVLKIIDFGISRMMTSGTKTPNLGFRRYKAPEVLFGSTDYTTSVDIWASGCLFAEMLRLKVLFPGCNDSDVIKAIVNFLGTPTESLWPGYSKFPVLRHLTLRFQPYNRIRSTFVKENMTTISFLQKLLVYNPSNRLTAEQCLDHPYFADKPIVCSTDELLRTLHASNNFK